MTADVEVTIVSLGAGERLAACLDGLPQACGELSWRVTVVDNSPPGQDLSGLLSQSPSATVIRSEGRRGFGANQNLALTGLVASRRARYALILNDDTELDPGSVSALVRHADETGSAGAVGPIVRDARGRHEPAYLAWPSVRQQVARAALPGKTAGGAQRGGWLNGSCLLVRTSALAEVGLFDPSFFLFFEETDLCLRLHRAGWSLEVCPDSSILHHGQQTTGPGGFDLETQKQFFRSRYLFFQKHHGPLSTAVLTQAVRLALLPRVCKSLLEAALTRTPRSVSHARALASLVLYRPSRPTALEREAALDAAL